MGWLRIVVKKRNMNWCKGGKKTIHIDDNRQKGYVLARIENGKGHPYNKNPERKFQENRLDIISTFFFSSHRFLILIIRRLFLC